MRQRVNALGFPFSKDITLGWCLDASAARLNHSCSPNCAVVQGGTSSSSSSSSNPTSTEAFGGSRDQRSNRLEGSSSSATLEVRAISSVDCGDELTISYLDLTDPDYGGRAAEGRSGDGDEPAKRKAVAEATAARRAALHEKYLFWCRCARCMRESAPKSDAPPPAAASNSAKSGEAPYAVSEDGAVGDATNDGGSDLTAAAAAGSTRQVAVMVPEGADPGDELRVEVSDASETRVLRVPVPIGAVPGTKLVVTY